jgi:hypothetical protein
LLTQSFCLQEFDKNMELKLAIILNHTGHFVHL